MFIVDLAMKRSMFRRQSSFKTAIDHASAHAIKQSHGGPTCLRCCLYFSLCVLLGGKVLFSQSSNVKQVQRHTTEAAELRPPIASLMKAMGEEEIRLHDDPTNHSLQIAERQIAEALAVQQRNAGNGEGALATLEQAHHAIPGDIPILIDLGIQAEALHHLLRATEVLQQALQLEPANEKGLYAIAHVEFDRQEFNLAKRHFDQYLTRRPNDATAHYGLGRVYQLQQQEALALAEYQLSAKLQPVQTEAYYQMGEIALEAERVDEARANFDLVLKRMPNHGGALTGMGVLNYRAKAYADAQAELQRAVDASPDYQLAHYYLGLTNGRLGDKVGSERELAIAIKLAAEQQGKSKPVRVQ